VNATIARLLKDWPPLTAGQIAVIRAAAKGEVTA
jgi:hypothetical protein